MSDESTEPERLLCHDCMRPVTMKRARSKLIHAARGMEEWVFCPRCATHRGIQGPRGPKVIK